MDPTAEHFRLLVESVQDYAIYLLDPVGTIESWNIGAQRLKGYTASEIVGHNFAEFFPPHDQESGKPAALLARALRETAIEDIGWRVRRDGSRFWASATITALHDDDGAHIGFAKVIRDMTDRAFRAFVETTHSIVWTTDGNGQPNSDSPTWRAFTGQTEEEWRGRRGWDPVHPDDVGMLRVEWPAAKREGRRFDAEFRLRRADGEYVWMGARAVPFHDATGNVREWFGVTFDISDRKRAELERERAIELWVTTLRSIGDAVIATDAQGLVTFMNPVAERLTGWSTADAASKSLREVFPIFNEMTGEPVENPVDKVLREGVIVGLANHTVLRNRDGVDIPIDDSGAPIRGPGGSIDGVVLVFRDASEAKREMLRRAFLAKATEELLEANDFRDALTRIAKLAVPGLADWVSIAIAEPGTTRTQQLAVVHVDPAKIEFARELALRYPPDPNAPTGVPNVIRTGKSEFYPEIPPELLERAAVDDEHRRIIRELALRSALVVPLRGKAAVFGAITFILAGTRGRNYSQEDLVFAEQLAQRAALMIERRRLEEEAERANRMKDEFLATMSHELRTPLQAILGYATMVERGIARDMPKALAAIVRNANAQTRLVEDVLDVSRITSGKLRLTMARVDLASAIRGAVEAIRPAATARRIRVVENIPSNLGEVNGDLERLQQVFWNLVSNAVKFTEPTGMIEITARRSGSAVAVTVKDNGRGIAPENLSVIFERFRQVDSSTTRQQGGLGLGLAIVRYLVEAHGGTASADSPGLGSGATFTVKLPIQVAALVADVGVAPTPQRELGPLRGTRVLLVDDDEDTREIIGEALVDAGAQVRQAASAREAMVLLQQEPPHILLSDIGMPEEDGYALIRRVRALAPEHGGDVPAIALTAFARADDVAAAEAAGFQLHIVKPVRLDDLITAVQSVRSTTS